MISKEDHGELGCNHVFSIGQKVDQMVQMSEEHGCNNCQERA
jgi:hypothetical protein